jgi:hypothetical protein
MVADNSERHVVTILEAAWVETTLERRDGQVEETDRTFPTSVEGTESEWEYECSCGASFGSYTDAEVHLRDSGD